MLLLHLRPASPAAAALRLCPTPRLRRSFPTAAAAATAGVAARPRTLLLRRVSLLDTHASAFSTSVSPATMAAPAAAAARPLPLCPM
jgi:hypothetical protein